MDDEIYLIWEAIPHRDIRDHKEIRGVVIGREQADAVLDKLREDDDRTFVVSARNGFWKEQVTILTPDNCLGDEG